MRSPLFFYCLALSFVGHGVVFALGLDYLITAPAAPTMSSESVNSSISVEVIHLREEATQPTRLAEPESARPEAPSKSPVTDRTSATPLPTKTRPKETPLSIARSQSPQAQPSQAGAHSAPSQGAAAPVIEGAKAADHGMQVVQASPGYFRNPRPEYPESARRGRREGVVRLMVSVDAHGVSTAVTVALSSGVEALDDSAVEAVRAWIFKPGSINGVPVASHVEVPIRFSLQENGIPARHEP